MSHSLRQILAVAAATGPVDVAVRATVVDLGSLVLDEQFRGGGEKPRFDFRVRRMLATTQVTGFTADSQRNSVSGGREALDGLQKLIPFAVG